MIHGPCNIKYETN
jgi:hypothetical protein